MTATDALGSIDPTLSSAIAELWAGAQSNALERVELIETYCAHRLAGASDRAQHDAAHAAAHKLAGTLGTFGLPRGSELARGIELALEDPALDTDMFVQLATQVVELRGLITGAATQGDDNNGDDLPEPVIRTAGNVLLVGSVRSFIEAVEFDARRRGLAVEHTTRIASDLDLHETAVLIDLESDPAAATEIRRARDHGATVLVTGVPYDFTVRSALVSAGAELLLPTGTRPVAAVDGLERLLAERHSAPRVDVFDTDPAAANALASEFAGAGLDAGVVPSLDELASAPRFQDAIVFGSTVDPQRLGDLVRMLRADPRWDSVALVALLGNVEDRNGHAHALMSAGADDVLDAGRHALALTDRIRAATRRHQVVRDALPGGPAVHEPASGAVATDSAPPSDSPRRLLVVDDDETITDLLENVLAARGYEVETLHDGIHAADLLADSDEVQRFDAVLLDVSLPGLDGFGVLRSMQEARTLHSVPVIMLTARVREEEVVRAWELGATDHVAKPFSVPVLLHRVEAARIQAR